MSMAVEEATAHVGGWVRVLNDNNEFSGGRLMEVMGRRAKVRFVGGKQDREVEIDKMQPWKSRNAQVGFAPKATPIKAVAPTPIAVKVDSSPAVKGGVIEDVSSMVARMGDLEREVDEMQQLETLCKSDYDAAKAAADTSRAALVEIRKELKLRLGL